MASPRVRRIRQQKRLQAAQVTEASPPAPTHAVAASAPEPTPVVIEMAEQAPAEDVAPVVIDMAPQVTEEEHETLDTAGDIDYNDLTKAELCKELDDRGIEYSRYSNKTSLLALLEDA